MNVKYQIFVSSTYEDLKAERAEVIKACLNMGHIPVGMEMFNAADEEQWAVITRTIDQCDYYVVIIAHRYGSTTPEGISFTEKEYDYAVFRGVPVLAFLIQENASWPHNLIEKEQAANDALEKFKSKVKLKLVRFWSTAQELRSQFVESLATAVNVKPRRGWIRAPEQADSDIAQTLSNLAEENARLRQAISESKGFSDEEIADVTAILQKMYLLNFSYADFFKNTIAPILISGKTLDSDSLAGYFGLDPDNLKTMTKDLEFYNVLSRIENGSLILTGLGRRVLLRLSAFP